MQSHLTSNRKPNLTCKIVQCGVDIGSFGIGTTVLANILTQAGLTNVVALPQVVGATVI